MIAPPRANPPRSISGTFRFAGLLLLVLLSLVGSGASSLVYQVAWFRELGVIFGVTVQATSAVLASFMAGLALGSLAAARIVPRLRNPFLIYGLIELGIGLTGFASLAALAVLQPLTRELVLTLGDQPTMLGLLRFALAFTILLIPTTLMGATLPVLLSAPVLREREHGATIGLIYAANTFGAIAGALTAGFILIGQYGLTVTVALAAGVNTGVGLVWLVAAGYTRRAPAGEAPTPPTGTPAYPPAVTTAVLVSYALSGGIALAYEVVWTRLLAGIFPGSVYAFAVMLSAILGGIAVGSWLITPLMNRQLSWPLVYVVLQLGMALTALLSLHILGQAYGIEAAVRARLAPDEGLLLGEPWYMALFSMLAIGPVALLMGVTFPVAARIFTVGQAQVGRRLGVIYGANVLGGLAGSLAGGLIVIPAVGAHGAIALLAVLNAIAGAVVLLVLPLASIGSGGVRVVLRLGIAAALVAAPAVASATPADFYETLFAQHPRGEQLLWYREGPDVTVQIYRAADGSRALRINSLEQGSDSPGPLQFHYRLGHLPMLLHPEPRSILMIGLGLGATAGAMAVYPNSEMTIIELHHAVVEAAEQFREANYDVLARPNVRLEVNDGRNYLFLTNRSFDIIETDPIVPTNAGAAFLYSREYFQLARRALNEGGYVVQWIDPDLPAPLYRLVLRTFLSVFPEATLWQQGAVLIGSNRPIEIDPIQIEAKLRDPALQPILAENHLLTTQDVLRERIAGPLALAELAGDGPLITDRQPWIEYFRSQPSGSRLPDFLWFPAARQIAAWAEPGDGLFTSHDELVAALDTVSGVALDRVALDDMQDLDRLRRLWVATRGDELLDPAFARQLQAGWHLVADDEVGHGRLRLFARPLLDPPLRPANVNAAGVLRLTGMAIDAPIVEVGGTMLLHVQWQIQRPPPGDLAIDVRLVDERGRIAAALRRLPVLEAGAAWSPGTVVDDRSGLRIPPGTPAGRYAIDLTLSTLTEGRPLLATAGGTLTVGLIRVHDAGRPFPAGAVVAARCAVALDDVHLVGVTLPSWAAPASTAEVQLYWQPQRDGAERQALLLLGDPAQPLATAEVVAGEASRRSGTIIRRDVPITLPTGVPAGRLPLWIRAGDLVTPIGTLQVRSR